MSRSSENNTRHTSFTIPIDDPEQAAELAAAFNVLRRYAEMLPFDSPQVDKPDIDAVLSLDLDAQETLSETERGLAGALCRRIAQSEYCSLTDLDYLRVNETAGSPRHSCEGLVVETASHQDWTPVYLIAALIQTAQERFGVPAVRFEWSDFEPDTDQSFGGGAMRVEPGKEPQLYHTGYLGAPDTAEVLFTHDAKHWLGELRDGYDLSDPHQRTAMVDKCIENLVVGTPLHEALVAEVFAWSQHEAAAEGNLRRRSLEAPQENALQSNSMPAVTLSPEEARKLLLSGARPPEHMIVTGSLDLSNLEFDERERLAALPDRLQVQGDLTLSSITGLTLFSRHLRVAGHAEIEQCQNFWSLGESIEADRLTVDWCSPRLASLPERTVVHRELTMRICPMLESLPDGLNLDSLTVSGAPKLTALPEDLRVRSNLRLAHCPITELPATAATLEGSLMLYYCRRLKRLPEALNVKNLSMRSLKALRQLPQVLTIGEDLLIRACPHIRQLPDNLHVPGYLDLTQHNTLEALPQNLHVGGSLWLVGCHKVESIGAGLTVGGDLRIENCRKIESIGAGLTVGERLISSDCPELSLAEFPADTEVAGDWFWWGRRIAGLPVAAQPAQPAPVQAVAEPEPM